MTRAATYEFGETDQASAGVQPGIKPVIRYAFCLFMFSLVFETVDLHLPVKFTSLAGAVFVLTTLLQPRMCYRQPPLAVWCFLGWVGTCVVMAVWLGIPHADAFSHELFVLVQSVLLFWIAYSVMLDPEVTKASMTTLVASCALLSILQITGMSATVVDAGTAQERIAAAGQKPSDIALMCALGLCWVAGTVFGRRTSLWGTFRSIGLISLLALAVMRTEARGAILALGAGLLMFTIQPGPVGLRVRNAALILLVAVALVAVAMRSRSLMYRFNAAGSGHMAGRERIYPYAMGMVAERPLLGWGFVTNTFELGDRVNHPGMPRRDPHNLFLFILTASGFVGGIPALLGLWFATSDAWKSRYGPYGVVPFAMMVTALVGNLSVTWYSKLFWITLGFACASWASLRLSGPPGPTRPGTDRIY